MAHVRRGTQLAQERVGDLRQRQHFISRTMGTRWIDGVRGASHMPLSAPQQDIELRHGEIPVLGTVNLDLRRAG